MLEDLEKLDFDPEALRERYRQEREIRLGAARYQAAPDNFVRDPYRDESFTRAPITRDLDVLVIGGGFGGLLLGAHLQKQGVGDFCIVDVAGDFGGAWYWNRYPGAACDIEAYIYMPLLEEAGEIPSQKFIGQPALFAHSQAIGRRFGLYEKALFLTKVTEVRWTPQQHRWAVRTDRGDLLMARFVCMSIGPVHQPKLPRLPGLETFKGHTFHTARWDYGYTGGSFDEPLVNLADKRVGIVGSAATAVQCVAPLAESAEHLYVFQRTPATVDARNNRDTDPQWAASLEPGWQARRALNFDLLTAGRPVAEDEVQDGRTQMYLDLQKAADAGGREARELADLKNMERIRRRIGEIVRDPEVAEALKPYYHQTCKRPCFQDGYLETFNRSNVTLVHTKGRGVEQVTERGVVAGGREYELDCLIFATGFEMLSDFTDRAGFQTLGRDGLSIRDRWKDGVVTLHSFYTSGFPNCLFLHNAQGPAALNATFVLEAQSKHFARLIRHCLDQKVVEFEPSAEGEQGWLAEVLSFAEAKRAFAQVCTPGYLSSEGDDSLRAIQDNFYGGGSPAFFKHLSDWWDGGMPGLRMTRQA